jgi:hypothetical protein
MHLILIHILFLLYKGCHCKCVISFSSVRSLSREKANYEKH